jgi:hypothetical protein
LNILEKIDKIVSTWKLRNISVSKLINESVQELYIDASLYLDFVSMLSWVYYRQNFPTNRFVGNFLQSTYENSMCPLNM